MKWTEERVQALLAPQLLEGGHDCVVPNAMVFGYEADLVAVRGRSKQLLEFEIKVTRSDFRADAKKTAKHERMAEAAAKGYRRRGRRKKKGVAQRERVPHYFTYVAPIGVIPPSEVPDHAGLLVIDRSGKTRVAKDPPLLRSSGISDSMIRKLWRKVNYRMMEALFGSVGATSSSGGRRRSKYRDRALAMRHRRSYTR